MEIINSILLFIIPLLPIKYWQLPSVSLYKALHILAFKFLPVPFGKFAASKRFVNSSFWVISHMLNWTEVWTFTAVKPHHSSCYPMFWVMTLLENGLSFIPNSSSADSDTFPYSIFLLLASSSFPHLYEFSNSWCREASQKNKAPTTVQHCGVFQVWCALFGL